MVRSLATMLVVGLVLGIGAPAFCQTYYYGNPYSGQQQAYGAYGQTYGQPGYQQYAQPGQYGQYNQYAQPQPGAGAYQTAPGSYYQNYGQYLRQGMYGYDPRSQAYAPQQSQQYPNGYYQQQAQPNPYYGVPQVQQWESPRTTYSTRPVRRSRSRSTRRARTESVSNANAAAPAKESPKEKSEIYWDPNADDPDTSSQTFSQGSSQRSPAVRAQNPPKRVRVRREARTTVAPPPPKRQTMAWGKQETKPPSRRPMRWGKEAKPVSVTPEPGSMSSQDQNRTPARAEVQVESKAPAKKFQWGRTE